MLEDVEADPKFSITVKGRMLRVPGKFVEICSGTLEEAVDGHTVQPYYTVLLADECGMDLRHVAYEDHITFSLRVLLPDWQ